MTTLFLFLLVLFTVTSADAATTWHVRNSGTNGTNCTQYQNPTTPAPTIAAARACATNTPGAGAGNTVEVWAGTYNESLTGGAGNGFPSGTDWNNPFTMKAHNSSRIDSPIGTGANGDLVVINPDNEFATFNSGSSSITINFYAQIIGFTFDGAGKTHFSQGINLNYGVRHLKFYNNDLINTNHGNLIYAAGEDSDSQPDALNKDVGVFNSKIHDGTYACTGSPGTCPGGDKTYVMYVQNSGYEFARNLVYNVPSIVIHAYNGGNALQTTPRGVSVHDNIMHDIESGAFFALGRENAAYNNVIYNATVAGLYTNRSGTTEARALPPNRFYGNTVYGSARGILVDGGAADTVFTNNLLVNNGTNVEENSGSSIYTTNLCTTSGGTSNCANIGQTAAQIFTNPGSDFTLRTGSNAIGAGTTLGAPYNADIIGANRVPPFDVGAYKYGGTSTQPVVTINSPTSSPTFTTSTASLVLGGTYTSHGGISPALIWTCDRCSSGTVKGTTSWTSSPITLLPGINIITVTATDTGGLGTAVITVTYVPTFPGNALVGAWGFENNGTDSSGNGNNATLLNGATFTTTGAGKFGQAMSLNGATQRGEVLDANSLDFTQSFTFSAWVQPTAIHSDFRAAVVKNYVQYLYASAGGSGSCVNNGQVFGGLQTNGASGPAIAICQATPLAVNTWTHIALTYDHSAALTKLYVNGVLVSSVPGSGIMEPSTGNLLIGASQFSGENFEGKIDEVRAYNWAIPISAGSNTVPGAACVFGNPLDMSQVSIIRDMNCPVIQTPSTPPLPIKFGVSATSFKISPSRVMKFGTKAP